MVQDTPIKHRDILTVMTFDGDYWPLGHAIALRDFDPAKVYQAFLERYKGPGEDMSDHYYNYLLKRKYIMPCPRECFKPLYL